MEPSVPLPALRSSGAARATRGLAALAVVAIGVLPAGFDARDLRRAWQALPAGLAQLGERLRVPFEIARLRLREPDARLAMPVEGVRAAQVADTWRAPRPGGRLHQGQDIFARRGTPVRSATAGYVVRVGTDPLGGRVVSVMGAGGRVYYYAHLDAHAPGLARGDRVESGTLLGRVGDSGNARGTPPHLHFGVYAGRGAIDPLPLMRDHD